MPRRSPSRKRPSLLTPKQLRVLTFIRDFTRAKGYAPTMQELADEFGVSKVTVFEHIAALQRKHCLRRSPHKARSLRLSQNLEFPDERPTRLPLAGTIAAGQPIEAVEQREAVDLEELFASPHGSFALRVRGDSMIEDQIADGDYVIVEKRNTPRDGETVVALLEDGEATLKRFYRDRNGIRLQPANPAYEPIITKNNATKFLPLTLREQFTDDDLDRFYRSVLASFSQAHRSALDRLLENDEFRGILADEGVTISGTQQNYRITFWPTGLTQ